MLSHHELTSVATWRFGAPRFYDPRYAVSSSGPAIRDELGVHDLEQIDGLDDGYKGGYKGKGLLLVVLLSKNG